MFIEIKNLQKSYLNGEVKTKVLDNVSLNIEEGSRCAIIGPSGSGKSTLLHVIGGLDQADSGNLIVENQDILKMSNKTRIEYRRNYLGYIFQFYNLIPNLTVKENIRVCENLTKNPLDIDELIDVLGLKIHENKFPSQLSGGQQQRCAIARALVKNPKLLLCDEPTGALDSENSKEIMVLLEEINKKYNTTMLIVTHNELICKTVNQIFVIADGKICEDIHNEKIISAAKLEWGRLSC